MKHLLCALACLLLPLLPQTARANDYSARILYFDDEHSLYPDLFETVEKLLSSASDYVKLQGVEHRLTFMKRGAYAFNAPQGITGRAMRVSEKTLSKLETAEIVETARSVLVQYPVVDPRFNRMVLEATSDLDSASRPYMLSNSEQAQIGRMQLPGGTTAYAAITKYPFTYSEWVPTIEVVYNLLLDGKPARVSIVAKPAGGLGSWYDSIIRRVSETYPPTLLLNTGHFGQYAQIGISTDTIRAYWDELGVNLVAFNSDDLQMVWKLASDPGFSSAPKRPTLLCSNISATKPQYQDLIAQQAVIDAGNVRIGFVSVIPQETLSAAQLKSIPFKALDPVEAAGTATQLLRSRYKADIVVLVSHLSPSASYNLALKVPDIDIAIMASPIANALKRSTILDLRSWGRERHKMPAYVSWRNAYSLGELLLEFADSGNYKELARVEDSAGDEFIEENKFSNAYYTHNEAMTSLYLSPSRYLLPDARSLWAGSCQKLSYSPQEIFNMAAGIIREAAGTEVAFAQILPARAFVLGKMSRNNLDLWLGPKTGIMKAVLKGSDLKSLLQQADFTATPTQCERTFEGEYVLAVSGANKNKEVNGLSITDSEKYTVAFPQSLLMEADRFPALKKLVKKETLDIPYPGAVLDWLEQRSASSPAMAAAAEPPALSSATTDSATLPPQIHKDDTFILNLRELMGNNAPDASVWRLNLREIAFQFSNIQVNNAAEFSNISNAKLRSNSQILVQGSGKLYSEYRTSRLQLDNGVSAAYGKVTIRPTSGDTVTNESVDQILLDNELRYRNTRFSMLGGGIMGPFVTAQYDTEFSPQDGVPKRKILRGKAGYKLYEGSTVKDFYAAAVTEEDFTYSNSVHTQYGWETGYKLTFPIHNGLIELKTEGYYRNLIRTRSDTVYDLKNELELKANLDVTLVDNLKMGPYVDYYRVTGKLLDGAASNFLFGIELSYSFLLKPYQ